MSITFDAAIANLQSMFPEWDKEMLGMILESNNYHVERTIESVLSMSGGENPAVEAPKSNMQPLSIDHGDSTDDILIDILGDDPPRSSFNTQKPVQVESNSKVKANATSRYRGIKCDLPDDFLRFPGWKQAVQYNIADEELAKMLQNEMFREQVRTVLGDSFIDGSSPGGAANGRRPSSDGSSNSRRPSRTTSEDNSSIMKSLSSMGSAAKKNLSQLAVRFSQSKRGESGNPKEFRQLVESGDNDDDEGATEVMFENHKTGRTHLLQGENDEETFGSENPLIKQNTNNLSIGKKAQ